MTKLHTFTSRRKRDAYLRDVWPGSVVYAVLNGERFVVHEHCRDGRIIASDYPPYDVFKLPSNTPLLLTWQEAEAAQKVQAAK